MQADQLTKEEKVLVAKDCYEDPVLFCKTFLPHYFKPPADNEEIDIPWFQRGLLAILTGKVDFLLKYGEVEKIVSNFVLIREDYDPLERTVREAVVGRIFSFDAQGKLCMTLGQHTLFILPRGYSKTTIAGVVVPTYNVIYQIVEFTLYVSHAAPHAEMQLDNVKRELESNPRILEIFGEMKPTRADLEKWSAAFFETRTGTAAAARGSGGQVRGLLHKGFRPQRVICDDLEDREEIQSETVRDKVRTWFVSDLKPVLPKLDPTARIIVLGTIMHSDSLLEHLKVDQQWSVVQMGVYDREGALTWARNMDQAKIQAEEASYARMGKLSNFYMEYHSKIIAPEVQVFHQERFQYGIPEEKFVAFSIAMDPAISEKRTADKTAIAVFGLTYRGNKILLDTWAERTADEDRKLDEYFRLIKKWNMLEYPAKYGIESVAYQVALANACKVRMARELLYFEIDPLLRKGNKCARIKSALQPIINSGHFWFSRHFPGFEQELVLFREDGSHEHDDEIDAGAHAVMLLDEFAHFSAPELPAEARREYDHQLDDILEGGFIWAQ